jgi:RIO-like serine/threonine protein kinase
MALSCKLTNPEFQKRKATVLASLRNKIIDKKELSDGYSYKFNGSDEMLDELTEFIKTERLCCDFFQFNLFIEGNGSFIVLELKGEEGAKDFIKNELEL